MTGAIVVLSGGADSTFCTFWAKSRFDEVAAITFDYDQKHSAEIAAARRVAELAEIRSHEVINLHKCLKSTSPLIDPKSRLETYPDFQTMSDIIGDRVELTFVPMRNTLFLTLAANRAIAYGCTNIVTGVCEEDGANYPDTTQNFIQTMQHAINASAGQDQTFTIHAPLMYRTKAESVKEAMRYQGCYSALAYSHTAYSGEYPPVTQDHATVLRAEGFRESGYPDPLIVRAYWEGLLDKLPDTPNYTNYKAALLYTQAPLRDPKELFNRLYTLELYFRSPL